MDSAFNLACIDYPNLDEPGCPIFGAYSDADGSAANDACCFCGGGTECTNLDDWVDNRGMDCTWYIENDIPGCPDSGTLFPNSDGITGNDACCFCKEEGVGSGVNGKVNLYSIRNNYLHYCLYFEANPNTNNETRYGK